MTSRGRLDATGPRGSDPRDPEGALRQLRFLGRGCYDHARTPSVLSMGHPLGVLQFRIERPAGAPPVVRVHDENLNYGSPRLAARLPALSRDEIAELKAALECSPPERGLHGADRTRLRSELGRVLEELVAPGQPSPSAPRTVAAFIAVVDAAWEQVADDSGSTSRPPLEPASHGGDDAPHDPLGGRRS